MKRWSILWNDLLNLFFPKTCLTCSKPLLENEEQICLECLCDLPYTNFHKKKENRIGQLFIWNISVEKATAFLYYEKGGHVQKLIHQLKYHDNPEIGHLLGRIAALKIQKEETTGERLQPGSRYRLRHPGDYPLTDRDMRCHSANWERVADP